MRNRLKSMAAVLVMTGGLLVVAPRLSHAEWPTFDAITNFLLQQAQNAMTSAVDKVYDNITIIHIADVSSSAVNGGFKAL